MRTKGIFPLSRQLVSVRLLIGMRRKTSVVSTKTACSPFAVTTSCDTMSAIITPTVAMLRRKRFAGRELENSSDLQGPIRKGQRFADATCAQCREFQSRVAKGQPKVKKSAGKGVKNRSRASFFYGQIPALCGSFAVATIRDNVSPSRPIPFEKTV